ncbi:MAG: hypothetical protein AB3N28_15540 [Kordiimonas sp.]
MKKYLIGFLVGSLVPTAVFFWAFNDSGAVQQPVALPQIPASQTAASEWRYEQLWSPVTTNFKYDDRQLGALRGFDGWPPSDYKYLSVTSNDALVEFTREAIERVCIRAQYSKQPDGHAPLFDAYIFLKPESRKQLGKALLRRHGQDVSMRMFGLEIHNFVVNREKATMAVDNAKTHNLEPDFSFFVPDYTMFTAFSMLKTMLDTDTLESCDPSDPLENFSPYVEHQAYWEGIKTMINAH